MALNAGRKKKIKAKIVIQAKTNFDVASRSTKRTKTNIGPAVILVVRINPPTKPKHAAKIFWFAIKGLSCLPQRVNTINKQVEKTINASGFGTKACLRTMLDIKGAS